MSKESSISPDRRAAILPVVLLLFLGMSWGLRVALLKLAAQSGIPHAAVAATTTLGVALCLSGISIVRRRPFPVSLGRLPFFLLCALIGYVVPFFLQLYAAARVPASSLALIFSLLPIATLIIAFAARTDRPTWVGAVSTILGIAAVVILLAPEVRAADLNAGSGTVAALLVPFTFGIYYNFVASRWPEGLDSIQVATGEVLAAIPLMLPIYFWSGAVFPFSGTWNTGQWAVLVMIVFWTIDTYLYFEIVRLAGPVFTSQANYVMLLSGVIWGAVFFAERPTAIFWLSLALVVIALALLSWQRLRAPRKEGVGSAQE